MRRPRAVVLLALVVASVSFLQSPANLTRADAQSVAPWVSHGVASGDVTATTAVVWARSGGRQRAAMNVEVSPDPTFPAAATRPGGQTWVDAASDHAGQVMVSKLAPGTPYHYRVWFGADKSAAKGGKFVTAPQPETATDVVFAWVSDLGGQGACRTLDKAFEGYPILDAVAKAEMHFLVFLGDQIYADTACPNKSSVRGLRQLPGPPPVTRGTRTFTQNLEIIRRWWAYNRAEPKFQRLLAGTSMYAAWDDHEIINDWGGKEMSGRDPTPFMPSDPGLLAAGVQTFLEWNPVAVAPHEPTRLYRKFRWGKMAELILLDNRSYRDRNDLPDGPGKSMLGPVQLAWLKETLLESTATWKIILTSVPLSIPTGFPVAFGRDGWGAVPDPGAPGVERTGFERELRDILQFIRDRGVKNVIWLTTDVHFAEILRYRPDLDGDGRADLEFYELVNGPLSAINVAVSPPARHSQTFRPEVLFAFGQNAFGFFPEFFNFGVARINGRTGELTVEIRDINGVVKGSHVIRVQ